MATATRPAAPANLRSSRPTTSFSRRPRQSPSATFTGLLSGAPRSSDIGEVVVEIYRVFPDHSDVGRTSGPPTSRRRTCRRASIRRPMSHSDSRDSQQRPQFLDHRPGRRFTALNSVQPGGIHPKPGQTTGGNGAVTGEEVQFNVTFTTPFDLPADHYFFVPQVEISDRRRFLLAVGAETDCSRHRPPVHRPAELDPR